MEVRDAVKPLRFVLAILAALCALSSSAVRADVRLTPVASGLSQPLFVGHAGDGSNRLFIVEQGGLIKVCSRAARPRPTS
jgi:hypothetical protein